MTIKLSVSADKNSIPRITHPSQVAFAFCAFSDAVPHVGFCHDINSLIFAGGDGKERAALGRS